MVRGGPGVCGVSDRKQGFHGEHEAQRRGGVVWFQTARRRERPQWGWVPLSDVQLGNGVAPMRGNCTGKEATGYTLEYSDAFHLGGLSASGLDCFETASMQLAKLAPVLLKAYCWN